MHDLFDLTSKIAIVTGGCGHLGRDMCEALSEYGANVVVASRDGDACRAFAQELADRYRTETMGMHADVCNTDSVNNLLRSVAERFGSIDILVNNAFVPVQGFVEEIDDALWQKSLDGNAGAVFRCIRGVLPYMQQKKRGKIINIASMYGVIAPDPGVYSGDRTLNNPACYGAGKAAIIQLTKYIAGYYGREGITVNCISPGPFPNTAVQNNQKFIEKLGEKTMLGRIGVPEEIKGLVVFLASDASNYITGQNICADGGATAW